jgi:hypothetical protein
MGVDATTKDRLARAEKRYQRAVLNLRRSTRRERLDARREVARAWLSRRVAEIDSRREPHAQ